MYLGAYAQALRVFEMGRGEGRAEEDFRPSATLLARSIETTYIFSFFEYCTVSEGGWFG